MTATGMLIWYLEGQFSKSVIFNCFQFKKSEHHPDYDYVFTVFLNFYPNRFCFIWEPHELVWKSVTAILHSFFGSIFYIFSKFSKTGTIFSDFPDSRPKKIGFWAWGRFWQLFMSKNSSIYLQFCKFYINSGRCSTKVFPMNLPVNMA